MKSTSILSIFGLPVALFGFALIATAVDKNEAYQPAIDPANFTAEVNNDYYTLTPGTTFTYQGKGKEGTKIKKVYVTTNTRKVMGVTVCVVRNQAWLNDKLIEEAYDWYAQDKEGNVWCFGDDYIETSKDQELIRSKSSWEAGINGAQPGIVMYAHPLPGEPYRKGYLPGKTEEMGQVLSVKENVKVPYGAFKDCVETKDWSEIRKADIHHKYYTKEWGYLVLITENGDNRMELIDFTIDLQEIHRLID